MKSESNGEYCPETIVKIKLWGLIIGLVAISGSLMGLLYARDIRQQSDIQVINERVIKIETIVPYINKSLQEISSDIREMKQMKQRK